MMHRLLRLLLWLAAGSAFTLVLSLVLSWDALVPPMAVLTAVTLALGIGSVQTLGSYQYTAWIVVAIVCGLFYPSTFLRWGDLDLRDPLLILIVVQVVMFGMGTQMSLKDFTGVQTMGKGVLVGILCQFSIMPLVGFLLTIVFEFDPEIAAGIILIGSCSSGLASNVMVFIARANLSLSVTLTAVATLLAPVMTPFLMKILAGTYVEVRFLDMCIQIIKIVIVPIGSAMLYDGYKNSSAHARKRIHVVFVVATAWLIAMVAGLWSYLSGIWRPELMIFVELVNFLFGAVVIGIVYYFLVRGLPAIHALMPRLSMFGIVYFTTVTTAASRDNILTIGLLLLLASILHNTLGYVFGYGISRLTGLNKDDSRTVALEVGLQNGGMASGLAGVMGKLATLGLASAVFSPWMNISGSLLANYWRKKDNGK